MKEKRILWTILILVVGSVGLSILTESNLIILVGTTMLLILISLRLICKPKELIIVTIIVSVFNGILTDIIGVMQFLPIYFYCLMVLNLLLSRKKLKLDKKLIFLTMMVFIMGVIPYLYTEFRIIPFFIGTIKKFGFIIVLLFTRNLNLDKFNLKKFIIRFIPIVLILNTIVAVFQFAIGYRSDSVVGFLGKNMTGTIGYLLMFYLAIEFSKEYKKTKMSRKIITPIIIVFIYAAIAEVKILFITSIFLSVIYLLIKKDKIKSFIMIVLISTVSIISYNYFVKIYPHHDFLSKEFLEDYLYSESYGNKTVNRFSFINDLNDTILDSDYAKVFGTGIGSGNPSKIKILRGNINEKYDYLKYYWFTTSYLYLEGGIIGLIGYMIIHLFMLCKVTKLYKRKDDDFSIIMLLFSIINIIFFVYSSGLLDYSISTIYWVVIGIGFNKKIDIDKLKSYEYIENNYIC